MTVNPIASPACAGEVTPVRDMTAGTLQKSRL